MLPAVYRTSVDAASPDRILLSTATRFFSIFHAFSSVNRNAAPFSGRPGTRSSTQTSPHRPHDTIDFPLQASPPVNSCTIFATMPGRAFKHLEKN